MLCNCRHGADSHGSPWSQGCRVIRKHTAETHRRGSSECSVSWERLVKVVIQELREKQRVPGSWNRYLSVSWSVHDLCAKSNSLVSGEQGPKQDRPPQRRPNGTSVPFKKQQVAPAQLPWQPQCRETPEAMERGEGRWRRHVVTFLEKPICSFLSENHIGEGGGKEWVLGC